jgi:diguanylate cyclase (GGDEF)-like protein/PAS domain S-box-containing protein
MELQGLPYALAVRGRQFLYGPFQPSQKMTMRLQSLKKPMVFAALVAVYFVLAKLSLNLAFVHPSVTPVWPPSGLALAAFILLGYWVWPAVFLGAFLANLTTAGSIATSVCIAAGNTLEALLAAYLLKRFAHGRHALKKAPDIFKFAVIAGMLSTAVAATIGVTSLSLGGFADWSRYWNIWITWWLGDGVGNVVFAPALILWANNYRLRYKQDQLFEATTLLACLVVVSEVVFNGFSIPSINNFPLELLCIPLLVWAAFRFGPRETAVATLVMSATAIHAGIHGLGPFAQKSEQESLMLIQAVTGVTSIIVLAVAANVSERKRLEATASHLAALVESSYDAIVGKSIEGTIVSWNSGAEQMYGYTAEEVIGKPISILASLDRNDETPQILARILRDEVVHPYETVRVRKDGHHIHVSMAVSPVRDAHGKIVGVSAISRDITERKRAEERFRLAVESAPNAMVVAGDHGKILLVNSQAEKLFGYRREELIGQSIEILVPQRYRDKHPGYRTGFATAPQARPMGAGRDLYAVRKDGSEFAVEIGLNPIETEEGTLVLSAIVDISERKRAEAAMEGANQRLKFSVARLERQTHEIALLNQLIQLLQTCQMPEEVYVVSRQFAEQLFPGESGAVCVFNPSVNLVETVSDWGSAPPAERVFNTQECWALRRGQPHALRDANGPLICQHLKHDSPIDSLCVPMIAQGETLGVLQLRRAPGSAGHDQELAESVGASREQLAVTVAGHIALALANLQLRDTLRRQSIRDPLTGLYNRRYLKESLEREVRRAARSQRPLAVIMLDVDHFKGFNDSLGHEAGDAVLREMGSFLQSRTRSEDIPCRYGGDEFVIILADTSKDVAIRRARQLQEGIKRLSVLHGSEYLNPPTISLGVAVYPQHGSTGESVLHAADVALYKAKSQGRDRVVVGRASETD